MMRIAAMTGFLFLAGCGGGGGGDGGGSGIDPRLSRIDIYEAQRLRVLGDPGAGVVGMPVTDGANMPDSGTATFTGSVTIRAETSPGTAILAGDATVVMDFGANDISGGMDNFFGTDPSGTLRNYEGSMTIDSGTIGDGTANAWQLSYSGVLDAPGQTFVLDGAVAGEFLGEPVAAIAGAEFEAQVIYNGDVVDGVVTIIGEGAVQTD